MEIVYCANCKAQVPSRDIAAGAAITVRAGQICCAKCKPQLDKTASSPMAKTLPDALEPSRDGISKFYFCETCGKRITDKQIEMGLGRDKKLKGVFCNDCAVGVMTMEMDAINIETLRKPNANRPTTPKLGNAKNEEAERQHDSQRVARRPSTPALGEGKFESPPPAGSHGLPRHAAGNKTSGAQRQKLLPVAAMFGIAVVCIIAAVLISNQQSTPRKMQPDALVEARPQTDQDKSGAQQSPALHSNFNSKPPDIALARKQENEIPAQAKKQSSLASAKRESHVSAPANYELKEFSLDLGGGVKMDFVLIPAGEFEMGAQGMAGDFGKGVEPIHRVVISKAFYLAKFEVTQAQYEKVMGNNPSAAKGALQPVESVTYTNAIDFCQKANQLTAKLLRLPTEAEWEYACRAGTAELATSSHKEEGWFAVEKPQPVGQKIPNGWGLYDMYGNVWEWCQDWYSADYYATSPSIDPPGPGTGARRVIRGGGFNNYGIRAGCRWGYPIDRRERYVGFRIVLIDAK